MSALKNIREYTDKSDNTLDKNTNKVNVLIQDLDKESLMMVMKFISDSKLNHSFKCGIIEYNEMEPHHEFGFGEDYEPGEGGNNELNQELYMLTYIRDNDKLPRYMESYVKDFINKVEEFEINYKEVEEEELAEILLKAEKMTYY